jgi:hypothetical protein
MNRNSKHILPDTASMKLFFFIKMKTIILWSVGYVPITIGMWTMFYSCTTVIDIDDLPKPKSEIVVEGTIENGVPPFLMLTKNSPYFGGISVNDLSQYFVHDAMIKVWTGTDTVQLIEFCINSLPVEIRQELAMSLGFNITDTANIPNVCIYSVPNIFTYFITGDTTGVFIGNPNTTYHLQIEVQGKVLTSKTTIPGLVQPDPLTWKPHQDIKKDSLASVYINFRDPDTLGNYYRYFTKRNDEPFYAPLSSSVYDDMIVNGQYISLPLERGISKQSEVDGDTYGYFWKGDTVTLKWTNIDRRSYEFWSTLENDGGDSPFSSPTVIKSNIKNGLGIWCGYATIYQTIIIPD